MGLRKRSASTSLSNLSEYGRALHFERRRFPLTLFYRDTVDSVGLFPRRLPFTTSNTIVRTFRHALALDERRAKFKANLWNRPTKTEENLGISGSSTESPAGPPPGSVTPVSEKAPSTPTSPTSSSKFSYPSFKKANSNGQYNGQAGANPRKERKRPSESEDDKKLDKMERIYSSQKKSHTTDIEEVWFAVRSRHKVPLSL